MLAHTLEIRIDFGNVLVTVLAKCLSEALVKNAHQFSGRINSKAKCFATYLTQLVLNNRWEGSAAAVFDCNDICLSY